MKRRAFLLYVWLFVVDEGELLSVSEGRGEDLQTLCFTHNYNSKYKSIRV